MLYVALLLLKNHPGSNVCDVVSSREISRGRLWVATSRDLGDISIKS